MAARTSILEEVHEAADASTPVLGVCNGAQIGAESRLTPVRSPRIAAPDSSASPSTCGSRTPIPRGQPPTTRATSSRCRSPTARGDSRSMTTT
jgi:hypothetical protein